MTGFPKHTISIGDFIPRSVSQFAPGYGHPKWEPLDESRLVQERYHQEDRQTRKGFVVFRAITGIPIYVKDANKLLCRLCEGGAVTLSLDGQDVSVRAGAIQPKGSC